MSGDGSPGVERALSISIVLPVLNEIDHISTRLCALSELRRRGVEVIVVDGGSGDGTAEAAAPLADRVLTSARGRARQMNAGADAASGDVIVFLHADTALPRDADALIARALAGGAVWGRFDVRLDSPRVLLRIVGRVMNLRTALSGIVTGDQTPFVRAEAFVEVGGFPRIALMEDIALSSRLRRVGRPARIRRRVLTSARRWEQRGILRTIVLMWRLRLAYFLGADPARLGVRYGYDTTEEDG